MNIMKEKTPLLISSHGTDKQNKVPPIIHDNKDGFIQKIKKCISFKKRINIPKFLSPATILGSIISSLYHVVYTLALASAITRRHGTTSLIGVISKMAVLGTVGASIQIAFLGKKLLSLYPSLDRFMIPLLVEIANCVDESLYQQAQKAIHVHNDEGMAEMLLSDNTFLATFSSLAAFGFFLSSMFCFLAYSIKLANLGAFLPNAVISGFFSTIGLLLFQFAFSVDNNGLKVNDFVSKYLLHLWDSDNGSHNRHIAFECIIHFIPSVIIGMVIRVCAPMHQLSTPLIISGVVVLVYVFMGMMGVSLEDAQMNHWFWTKDELIYDGASQVSLHN